MAWSTQGASASRWKYDVYFSFIEVDSRETFTGHLRDALVNAGFRTVWDGYEFAREGIRRQLEMAIQQSRASVIVFSKDYAFSEWCLDKLVMILERKRTSDHVVLPVFYNVDPSHVRKQTGSIAEAFAEHEAMQSQEKLNRWRDALMKVADIYGWDRMNYEYELKLVQDIVEVVNYRLGPREFEPIDQKQNIETESTSLDEEDFEATAQAVDQTQVSRSQRLSISSSSSVEV